MLASAILSSECAEPGGNLGKRFLRGPGSEAPQLPQHPAPAAALVGHEGLKERKGAGLDAALRRKLHPAEELRDCGEPGRGEEAGDLELGVDALFELADHLEDCALADADRGVRLLGAAAPYREAPHRIGADGIESRGAAEAQT